MTIVMQQLTSNPQPQTATNTPIVFRNQVTLDVFTCMTQSAGWFNAWVQEADVSYDDGTLLYVTEQLTRELLREQGMVINMDDICWTELITELILFRARRPVDEHLSPSTN